MTKVSGIIDISYLITSLVHFLFYLKNREKNIVYCKRLITYEDINKKIELKDY